MHLNIKGSTPRSFAFAMLTISIVAILTAGCESSRRTDGPPNIILIVVDTLRADRLAAYGNTDGLTPFIDSLSNRGYVFRNAYAASSWTFPSIASLFTSRFPHQHTVVRWESILPESEITFPESLKEAGYNTFAFQANALVREGFGFARGFSHYRTYPVKREKDVRKRTHTRTFHERASVLNRDALAKLRASRTGESEVNPFFLYMQYMEPHYPWRPTRESLAQTLDSDDEPDLAGINSTFYVARALPPAQETWTTIRAVYDAAVRDLDIELRYFFGELDAMGALENTYIILVSDHGEQLGEHGGLAAHGISLFNEEIHVPFIVVPPGHNQRKDVLEVVSLVDLGPTIVKLAGLVPPSTFVGRSLDSLLNRDSAPGSGAEQHGAYSSLDPQVSDKEVTPFSQILHRTAFVRQETKIVEKESGELTIYRLDEDPGETIAHTVSQADRPLERAYHLAAEAAEMNTAKVETEPISPSMRARLKALGYAE